MTKEDALGSKKDTLELLGVSYDKETLAEMGLKEIDTKLQRNDTFRILFVLLWSLWHHDDKARFSIKEIVMHPAAKVTTELHDSSYVLKLFNVLRINGYLIFTGKANSGKWMFNNPEELFTTERIKRVKEMLAHDGLQAE